MCKYFDTTIYVKSNNFTAYFSTLAFRNILHIVAKRENCQVSIEEKC